MKRKFLPALIMLVAGAVDCVLSIVERLPMLAFTKRLLVVLVLFYVLGTLIMWIIDANFPEIEISEELREEVAEEEPTATVTAAAEGSEEREEELENINSDDENR